MKPALLLSFCFGFGFGRRGGFSWLFAGGWSSRNGFELFLSPRLLNQGDHLIGRHHDGQAFGNRDISHVDRVVKRFK